MADPACVAFPGFVIERQTWLVLPFQVGGMGDVVTALGRAVQEEGHKVEVILPKYDCIQYDEVRSPKLDCIGCNKVDLPVCDYIRKTSKAPSGLGKQLQSPLLLGRE